MYFFLLVALFTLLSVVSSSPILLGQPSSSPTPTKCVPRPTISPVSSVPSSSSPPNTPTPSNFALAAVLNTPVTSTSTAAPISTPTSNPSSGPFFGGVATYFYQNGNPGACGQVNPDNQARFGYLGNSSPLCGKRVSITNNNSGASLTVTVADDCPTCRNSNSIDLSIGAFSALASGDLNIGEFDITWHLVD